MKVGTRQQQGRTGSKIKEVCPICKDNYLQSFFGVEDRKLIKKGYYCPVCDYCKKD